jgi:glutamate-1-semialdehyde 2,1-aminomutase
MTKDLHAQAKALTPWGTQLLSKKPELYAPGLWPSHFSRAEGCQIWDVEGKRYLDFAHMGVGSSILGYADPAVNAAVKAAIDQGTVSSLNPPEEVELAELLIDIHPWATRARFTRTGGEALAVAIRLARATTGRSGIAACGYHGWHDWYLAANLGNSENLDGHLLPGLQPLGVPRELAGTTHLFHYNQIGELEELVKEKGDSLAAICMEPLRRQQPKPGFLDQVREIANSCGALLIFDEVTASLDILISKHIMDFLKAEKARGKAILFVFVRKKMH